MSASGSDDRGAKSRRRWAVGLAVLLGTGLGVTALEGAARYREGRREVTDMNSPLLYYSHSKLGRALVRDADYNARLHVNHFGLRGREIEARKDPATTRIIVVGASAAFDICAARDAESWPARLESHLEALSPARAFEVLNAGVPGYLMIDNIIRLQTELLALDPDMIVIYAGHGAVSAAGVPRDTGATSTPGAAAPVTPWGDWLVRHSLLYNKVSGRVGALLRPAPDRPGVVDWKTELGRAVEEFRRDLTSFVLIAGSAGARVVVVELAAMNSLGRGESLSAADSAVWQRAFAVAPAVSMEGFRRFSAVQRDVAAERGALFVPAREFGITGRSNYCTDPIHFSRAGADRMGRALALALLQNGALGTPSP